MLEPLHQYGNEVFLGSSSVRIFHGQRLVWQDGARRVDGWNRDGRNTRSEVMECPVSGPSQQRGTWYIGHPDVPENSGTHGGPNSESYADQLRRWGHHLYRDGYVGPLAQAMVFPDAQRLSNGHRIGGQQQLDPDRRGPYYNFDTWDVAARGQNNPARAGFLIAGRDSNHVVNWDPYPRLLSSFPPAPKGPT